MTIMVNTISIMNVILVRFLLCSCYALLRPFSDSTAVYSEQPIKQSELLMKM